MKTLHHWKVNIKEAIEIQNSLRKHLVLKNTFKELKTIGGADVSYSSGENLLFGAIALFSFPDIEFLDQVLIKGRVSFPYLPGLLTFREGPILIRAFQKLKTKPDLIIFDGQGIAHPRGIGLASHIGLLLDLPTIGCAKTPLLKELPKPGPFRGDFERIWREGKEIGAVLRTKDHVKPVFVSPGHRIDLMTSIHIVLKSCKGFRLPEPLRKAHELSHLLKASIT